MVKLSEIVVDSLVPSQLARFWAEALDDFHIREYDETELARLMSLGFSPDTDPTVALDGHHLTIFFQTTTEAKTTRNRLHFDISAEDLEEEVRRLQSLGAQIRNIEEGYAIMLDPEGNEFCVTNPK